MASKVDAAEKKIKAAEQRALARAEEKRLRALEKKLNPQTEAEREALSRDLARRTLLHYIERSMPTYLPGWVHEDICRRLERFVIDVEQQKGPRLMLWLPPRSGKSEIASVRFPEWLFGRHPDWEIIASSYSDDLPLSFSRRIRARLQEDDYQALFPSTALSKDTTSVELWKTTKGGGFRAAGVGGGITGMGAHVLIVDDPFKDQEQADSEIMRAKVWDWFTTTAYTRLAPGGGVLCIQCMTGDTPVLRPDGSETRLDELRVGDEVATYDDGHLSTSKVVNWASQGEDDVYAMTTSSGRVVRANRRHPFFVTTGQGLKWTRLQNLRSGQRIVVLKDSGESGKTKFAQFPAATNQSVVEDFARHITTRQSGLRGIVHLRRFLQDSVKRISSIGTELLSIATQLCSQSKTTLAQSAEYLNSQSTPQSIGSSGFVSTTTRLQDAYAGYFVTTVTSYSSAAIQQKFWSPHYDTEDFTTETILSIEPAGREEVFDVQIASTENFIANGIVSHNTRWHDDDLSGRLETNMREVQRELAERYAAVRTLSPEEAKLEREALLEMEQSYDNWEIVKYPAIATEDEYFDTRSGRILRNVQPHQHYKLLRKKNEALHPARFNRTQLLKIKRTLQPRHWSALYQQNPIPDEGLYFTKDMFRYQEHTPDHRYMYTFVAWDLAIGMKQTNDWTVGIVGGLDYDDNLHILDMVRGRWTSLQIANAILETHVKYKALLTGIEKGVLEMAVRPHLERLMQEKRQYITLADGDQALKPITDKVARARPLQGRMQQGKVIFPTTQPWVETLRTEFLRFPGGVHDDIVDATAWLARMILGQAPPQKPKPKTNYKSWKDKLSEFVGNSPERGWMAS